MTEGYRKARNATAKASFAALLWSVGTLQTDSVSLGAFGKVDLSAVSIPLLLMGIIIYLSIFLVIEFVMQPTEARQVKLAQIDFDLTSSFARCVLLLLATSHMYRSTEVFLSVIALFALLIGAVGFAFLVVFLVLLPIMIYIRSRQGRYNTVSRIQEAEGWAHLCVVGLYLVLFPFICEAVFDLPLLRHTWEDSPNLPASYFMGATVSLVLLSVHVRWLFKGNLFDTESKFRWSS